LITLSIENMASVKRKDLPHRLNSELADIFLKMSACYSYLGKEERFRARAYEEAAHVLSNMEEPVNTYGDNIKALDELKGIGESIAQKIVEYEHSGQIAAFENLKKQVPEDLLELMEVEGIGPATIRKLHDELHVNTRAELAEAIAQGKLNSIKGFSEKKTGKLEAMLKPDKEKKRIPLSAALTISGKILKEIKKIPFVEKAEIAGSIRRKKESIGDIDIIIVAAKRNHRRIVERFTRLPMVEKVMAAGNTKASVLVRNSHVQVDIRVVEEKEFGSALFYFTGSKEHNIRLRLIAKQKGWKMNEYGVFEIKGGKRLAGETERGIYSLFGYRYIPPEKRLGGNELENAKLTHP
jgi:DNA polymerase (family 10)